MPQHVFISYARKDDKPFGYSKVGWVTRFRQDLENALAEEGGDIVKVWHDKLIEGNTYFADAIKGAATTSSLLLPIISPAYIEDKSGWLRSERDQFIAGAQKSGGLRFENRSRICPILRRNIDKRSLPSELGQINLKHRFFDQDDKKSLRDQEYEDEVYSVAETIREMLGFLAKYGKDSLSSNRGSKCIYLALATKDLQEDWDQLRAELIRLKYEVLSQDKLEADGHNQESLIEEELSKCAVSVHLVGSQLQRMSMSERCTIRTQQRLAQKQSASGLVHVVWVPPYLDLNNLTKGADKENKEIYLSLSKAANFSRDNFEKLLSFIVDKIKLLQNEIPSSPVAAGDELPPGVMHKAYIVCEQSDREALSPIKQLFAKHAWFVELPPDTNDEREFENLHKRHLRDCQAFIIYFGSANHLWVDNKRLDYRTAQIACGGRLPLYSQWIYRGPEPNLDKQNYEVVDPAYLLDGDFSHPFTSEFVSRVITSRANLNRLKVNG